MPYFCLLIVAWLKARVHCQTSLSSSPRPQRPRPILPDTYLHLRMSFLPSGSTSNAAASSSGVEVTDPPTDSISSVAFSGAADFLAVGSWNNEVRASFSCRRSQAYLWPTRYDCMKSMRKDRRRGGPSTRTRLRFWDSVGTRCVEHQTYPLFCADCRFLSFSRLLFIRPCVS